MLLHNIKHSEDTRTIKKLLNVQMEEGRRNTWYDSVNRIIEEYEVELPAEETKKSKWKNT